MQRIASEKRRLFEEKRRGPLALSLTLIRAHSILLLSAQRLLGHHSYSWAQKMTL